MDFRRILFVFISCSFFCHSEEEGGEEEEEEEVSIHSRRAKKMANPKKKASPAMRRKGAPFVHTSRRKYHHRTPCIIEPSISISREEERSAVKVDKNATSQRRFVFAGKHFCGDEPMFGVPVSPVRSVWSHDSSAMKLISSH